MPTIGGQCGVCGAAEEIGLHTIHKCRLARRVRELILLMSWVSDGCRSVVEWWGCCLKQLEGEDVVVFLTLSWAIWGAQCKIAMEGECGLLESILAYGLKMVKEVREAKCEIMMGRMTRDAVNLTAWARRTGG